MNFNDLVLYLSAEPCDLPCPTSNQIPSGGGVGAGGGGSGGRGSSPSVSGVAAPSPSPSQSHSSPYDLRRKSPPHPDPAPGTSSALPPSGGSSIAATFGSSSLPARKRPRRTCSTSTDGMSHRCSETNHRSVLPRIVLAHVHKFIKEYIDYAIILNVSFMLPCCIKLCNLMNKSVL